jgi:hypothetical protein
MKLHELFEDTDYTDNDVSDVALEQGFKKEKTHTKVGDKSKKITLLTKDEKFGSIELNLQYVINPETGAWSFRAAPVGRNHHIEMAAGEDTSTLIKHLNRKTKLKPNQIVDYIMTEAEQNDSAAPSSANWVMPSKKTMRHEYTAEYQNPKRNWEHRSKAIGAPYPLADDLAGFENLITNGNITIITDGDFDDIHGLTDIATIHGIKRLVASYRYPQDVDALVDAFRAGEEMELPVIIEGAKGRWLLDGNTRLNVARALGLTCKAVVVTSR